MVFMNLMDRSDSRSKSDGKENALLGANGVLL